MHIYIDTWMYRIWQKKKKTSKDKNNPGANKGNIAQLTKKKKIHSFVRV